MSAKEVLLKWIAGLILAMTLVCGGCSDPLGPGSRRVFFRNNTSVAYQVRTRVNRLQVPVDSWVDPGGILDISLVSLDDEGHLFVGFFPERERGWMDGFIDVELELALDSEGRVDPASVSIVAVGEAGVVDSLRSRVLREELEIVEDFSSYLLLEARESQDSLRIFVDNQTDSTQTVVTAAPGYDDTVEVAMGLFPVTEILPSDTTRTIIVTAGGQASLELPMEKDILIQVWRISSDSLEAHQRFDVPPAIRTGESRVRYRVLAE